MQRDGRAVAEPREVDDGDGDWKADWRLV